MNREAITALAVLFFYIALFITIVIFSFVEYRRKNLKIKQKIELLNVYASQSGYKSFTSDIYGLIFSKSSYGATDIVAGFRSELPQSNNSFYCGYQSEIKSSSNSNTSNRTILAVKVPNTQMHMILNSRLAYDSKSGDKLILYSNKQRYVLEGDFGQFYDVYMPNDTQSETLTILSPDTMLFLLKQLVKFDIEIVEDNLYVYAYELIDIKSIAQLIANVDILVGNLKLRLQDAVRQQGTGMLVARTAMASTTANRALKKTNIGVVVSISLLFIFMSRLNDH